MFAKSQSLPRDLKPVACPTITGKLIRDSVIPLSFLADIEDAYKRLSKYTVLPLENTIYGAVNETLDCLFSTLDTDTEEDEDKPFFGSKMIVAALDLPISHCLVVKKGTLQQDIKWVRSHEQVRLPSHVSIESLAMLEYSSCRADVVKALGQCTKFLDEVLPNAKRIPTSSTALAAQSLFTESEPGAALCSRSVLDSNPDLEILYEGTQDKKGELYLRCRFPRDYNLALIRELTMYQATSHDSSY